MASTAASGSGTVSESEVQRARSSLASMTVVELKGTLRDFASHCGARVAVSGTKMALINRIGDQLTSWMHSMRWYELREAIRLISAPRDSKGSLLATSGSNGAGSAGSASGSSSAAAASAWANTMASSYGPGSNGVRQNTSSLPGYNRSMVGAGGAAGQGRMPSTIGGVPSNKLPAARPGPSMGYVGQPGSSSALRTAAHTPSRLNFKPSPFWKIQEFVSPIIVLAEAAAQNRRTGNIDLRLNPQHNSLIKMPNSSYQVRLFCTTKAAAEIAERSPNHSAHIDFPMSCELRINGNLYSSSLKGSKKMPGRVPPPNLAKDKTLMTRDGMVNKIELVYANVSQKHVMAVALCSYTSVDTIVSKLRQDKYKTREEIVGTMKKAAAEDDIEVGTSTLSLRDPLSYTRIQAPCRSVHCSHTQCFDASFYFMSNEQSPTWTCPHCSKTLRPEDLFIDGYFDDILKRVPEDEDNVEVDPDGSWHTRDGKVTSSSKAIPPAAKASLADTTGVAGATKAEVPSPQLVTKQERDPSVSDLPPATPTPPVAPQNGISPSAEIVTLEDSPTPPPASARLTTSHSESANGASGSSSHAPVELGTPTGLSAPSAAGPSRSTALSSRGQSAHEAIDLTLSDSDDEPPSPPPPTRRPPTQPSTAAIRAGQALSGGGSSSSGSNLSRAFGMPPPEVRSAMAHGLPANGVLHHSPHNDLRPATASPVTSHGFSQWANSSNVPSTSRPSLPQQSSFSAGMTAADAYARPFPGQAGWPPSRSQDQRAPINGAPLASSSSSSTSVATATAPPAPAETSSFGARLARFRQANGSQEPTAPLWPPPPAATNTSISSSATSSSNHASSPNSSSATLETRNGVPASSSAVRARDTEDDAEEDASTLAPASKRLRRTDSTEAQRPEESSPAPVVNGASTSTGSATADASRVSTPLPSVSPSPPPSAQRRQPRRSGAPVNYDEQDDEEDEDDDEPVRGPRRARPEAGAGNSSVDSTSGEQSADQEFDELSDSAFDQVEDA